MEQEVESLVPVSNGYLYYNFGQRVGEMKENAKKNPQDTSDKMRSILNL